MVIMLTVCVDGIYAALMVYKMAYAFVQVLGVEYLYLAVMFDSVG